MRQLQYNRYWERRKAYYRRRGRGVLASWYPRVGKQNFNDYHPDVPGTIPEKILYQLLIDLRVSFYYAPYFGDLPFTEDKEEHYRPDFLLPDYRIIIEVQGVYWHTRPGAFERDFQRAMWLYAAGYKLYTITDRALMRDPYAALAKISELANPAVRGGKVIVGNKPSDPAASIRARLSQWPKVFAPEFRDTHRGVQGVIYAYKHVRLGSGYKYDSDALFDTDMISQEYMQPYIDYGKKWKKYIKQLGAFFKTGPEAKNAYPALWKYYQEWKGWWDRFVI